ncbi:MAG: LysM peptidoglycan-binding domain-containing protein [Trueperaceae bacterium]|nr:LysM peptidoglycan-binding domain-containing protein [Trueperaceae bacterium]
MPCLRVLLRACTLSLLVLAGHAAAQTVTVQSGDSLWSLARAFDTTVADLMAANGLDGERLSIGQVLELPSAGAAATAAAAFESGVPLVYVVQPGDSLWSIARAHDTSAAALMALNGLASETIRPGAALRLPGMRIATAAASAAEMMAPAPAAEAASPAPAAAPSTYVVRSGDSLYDIALSHDLTVDALIAWNDLDGTLIRPGQVLNLARDADAPPAPPLVVHVQPGDSLWSLARAHGSTVDALAMANGLTANSTLRVGLALTVPGRFAAIDATTGAPTTSIGGAAAEEVRVAPGDNLWKIARQHNTTIAAIMALNGLTSDRLAVGEVLRVLPGPDLGVASDVVGSAAFVPQGGDAMVWPLVGQITSRFGWRRLTIGGSNLHNGLDIGGRTGDPIRSATAGVVVHSGWRSGYGYLVVVENGDTEYWYGHASVLVAAVGDRVSPGDLIARVGATGVATGPHLHFEIRVAGTPIDPLPILEARARR